MTKVKGWVCWEQPVGNYQIGTDSDVTNVGKDVPTTQQPDNRYALTPQNLDFSA